MIYLDSSVVLAHLLAERRAPPTKLWDEPLVSSRLLEYEVWNRIHAHDLARSHGEAIHAVLEGIDLIELAPPVLARALESFPGTPRTLDALHLATIDYLRAQGRNPKLATYDTRLVAVARKMKVPIWDL